MTQAKTKVNIISQTPWLQSAKLPEAGRLCDKLLEARRQNITPYLAYAGLKDEDDTSSTQSVVRKKTMSKNDQLKDFFCTCLYSKEGRSRSHLKAIHWSNDPRSNKEYKHKYSEESWKKIDQDYRLYLHWRIRSSSVCSFQDVSGLLSESRTSLLSEILDKPEGYSSLYL